MAKSIGAVLTAYLGWISQIITSFMANETISFLILVPIVAGVIMVVLGIFKSFLH